MAKCIKCGHELMNSVNVHLQHDNYWCGNKDCSEYQKPWKVADHKDNEEWAVRHIRALEEIVKIQQAQIEKLTKLLEGIS